MTGHLCFLCLSSPPDCTHRGSLSPTRQYGNRTEIQKRRKDLGRSRVDGDDSSIWTGTGVTQSMVSLMSEEGGWFFYQGIVHDKIGKHYLI